VATFCKRNTFLSDLIAMTSSPLHHFATSGEGFALGDDSSVALLPSLFQVAKQATRHTPNNILIGLRTLVVDVPVASL
jgi:hypothetical protein